jgi:hypothetical protein
MTCSQQPGIAISASSYPALNTTRSFRVLKLHGSFRSALTCELIEASLDAPPPFEALSYAWDAQSTDQSLICNGRLVQITPNCEAALRRLRYKVASRVLWIDAICIDQKSDAERSHQVQLMGQIYRAAQQVLVWLGESEGDKGVRQAFKSMSRIARVSAQSAWKSKARSGMAQYLIPHTHKLIIVI